MSVRAVVSGADPVADDTIAVPWWSFGKTVLAAAALRLVEAGALALDEPLPGGAYALRALLQHRAGLNDYGILRAYHEAVARGDAPWSEADMLARVAALPHPADHRFRYSNVGYLVVRKLIEAASGSDLAGALDRLVLRPLGIAGVRLATTTADLGGTAWGNARAYDPNWVYHGLLIGPAGSAAMLLHRLIAGELLPPGLLAQMRAPLAVDEMADGRPWRSRGYGLGLMIGTGEPPLRFEGHTGGGPGSRIAVYHAAATGRTVCVASPVEDEAAVERDAMSRA